MNQSITYNGEKNENLLQTICSLIPELILDIFLVKPTFKISDMQSIANKRENTGPARGRLLLPFVQI